MISIKKIRKFIVVFLVVVMLLSFLIPSFDTVTYMAATIIRQAATMATETTDKRPHGFKIENAEYWDYNENYDKKRIWIDQGGGGSGEGGGAGDHDANDAGNSGTGDEKGGIMGHAAGVGLGGGNTQNQGGSGASTNGTGSGGGPGSSGSTMADALRALKEEIAESRAESLAKYLETALNASKTAASIAERESIQESIQRKLAQESIKEKLIKETLPTRENLIVAPANYAKSYVNKKETMPNVTAPTATERLTPQITERREATIHIVDAIDMIEAKISNSNQMVETVVAPTSAARDMQSSIAPPEIQETKIQYSEIEPGDIVAQQQAEEQYQKEIEAMIEKSLGESKAEETTANNTDDEDEGKGSKGGEDAEADEDMKGDEAQNESMGSADSKGQFQSSKTGDHAGKKVFEIDVNGNLGLNPDRMSHISARKIVAGLLSIIFIIGAIMHFRSTSDKKDKNNYF